VILPDSLKYIFSHILMHYQRSEHAVAFMCLLDGHQMGNLDPIPVGIGMDDVECGKRSPYVEAKYLYAICIQAFFISSVTGIRICLQNGKFFRDDALRLLRQSIQEIRR